jgi:hypothetical protein
MRVMLQRILSSPRGRVLAVVLALGVVGVGVWAGIAVLGSGGPAHPGEVRFAAFQGVSVCDVGDAVEVLPSGSLVFWSAIFASTVPVGHELIVERTKDGVIEAERSQKFTAERAIDCMGTPIADGPLYSGTYTFTIRDGETILATGSLTIR